MEAILLLILAVSTTTAHFGGLKYVPSVGNIASGRSVSASSTCGLNGPEQYCSQESDGTCGICNNQSIWLSHHPHLMIDGTDPQGEASWWQSATNTSHVDIEIDLGSRFFFNHIIINFKSWRPAAMGLYKSIDHYTFESIQFYSDNCTRDFPIEESCTSVYSLPSPGQVIYQTPSNVNLSDSNNLQQFLIFKLRIRLFRFHTPVQGSSPQVDVRNYYAINNIDIFGWCFCSGLAGTSCSYTEKESNTAGMVPSVCQCAGNTMGQYCDRCQPLYGNSPWRSGFDSSANYSGCPYKCDCNNRSSSCVYDYNHNGGVCQSCTHHTTGPNCQYCSDGHYMYNDTCIECTCHSAGTVPGSVCMRNNGTCSCRDNVRGERCDTCKNGTFNLTDSNPLGCQACSCSSCEEYTGRCPCSLVTNDTLCCPFNEYINNSTCITCSCDSTGSYGVCHDNGQCACKPGVTGRTCNECADGFHSFSDKGCSPCNCSIDGSRNPLLCNKRTGQCDCISPAKGLQCDQCPVNSLGPVKGGAMVCIPCYCNGHSKQCKSEPNWFWDTIKSNFNYEWMQVNPSGTINNNSHLVVNTSSGVLHINFPRSYLGNKYICYGLHLSFGLLFPSSPQSIRLEMFSIIEKVPTIIRRFLSPSVSNHSVPLIGKGYMRERFGINTPLTEEYIMRQMLGDIIWMRLVISFETSVPVINRYVNMTHVALPYIRKGGSHYYTNLISSPIKESCTCSMRYTGGDCQSCAMGYSRDPPNGNQFTNCGKCSCEGLAESCDPVTNECINCRNNTTGTHCTECQVGYYRNVTCLPCNCPGGPSARNQFTQSCNIIGGGVVCNNCPTGFTGNNCDKCDIRYYGNPLYENGTCRLCTCNNNSRGCDPITGTCTCNDGYIGDTCQYCQIGYYGNALSHDCKECGCHDNGTVPGTHCNIDSGQCICRSNVLGRTCNMCSDGYWNINSLCTNTCNCSATGSLSTNDCNKVSGQCSCKQGYEGRTCNTCIDGYWRTNNGSCISCNCNPSSSLTHVCNKRTGTCTCINGVIGDKCTSCSVNSTGLLPYCLKCDQCSLQWTAPINNLKVLVSNQVNRARLIKVTNITHTQSSQELTRPILDLLSDIQNNLTDYNSLLQHTLLTHRNITNLLLVIRNLIQRANTVLDLLNSVNNTLSSQKIQLENIRVDLERLCDILDNLTAQTNRITLKDFTQYTARISSAVVSSMQTNQTVENVIKPSLEESTEQLHQFIIKENSFVTISSHIVELITILRQKLQNYQNLIVQADHVLCGKDIQTLPDSLTCGCHGNSDRCEHQCGGIGCSTCSCNDSTINTLKEATSLSEYTLQSVMSFKDKLTSDVERLRIAYNSSNQSHIIIILARELSLRENTNTSQILADIKTLTSLVYSAIDDQLLNVNIIKQITNETIKIKLRKTPQQIVELLERINNTIQLFPVIPDYSHLLNRSQKALQLSLQTNITINTILRNISNLRESIQFIYNETITLRTIYNQSRQNISKIQSNVNKGRERVSLIQSNINKLSEKISTLNNSLKSVNTLFKNNSINLRRTQNVFNKTSERVTILQENLPRTENKLHQVTNETNLKQLNAQQRLLQVKQLRERMSKLRNEIHNQILQSRSLQNRKLCLLSEQDRIRDDIKRVAAELETIQSNIQTHVGRNTLCMKKFLSSKK